MSTLRTYLRSCWLPAVLLLLFPLLASLRMPEPMGQDELSHYYKLAQLLFHNGFQQPEDLITFSPHAYPLWVACVCRVIGACGPMTIKAAGLLLWLFCLVLIALISQRLAKQQTNCSEVTSPAPPASKLFSYPAATIGLLICVTMPAAIQAAVTVDIDQAALPLLILLLCLAAERWCRLPTWQTSLCLTLAFTLSLWGRITTPVVLAPVLLLHSYLSARPGQRLRTVLQLATLLILGAILFLLTWRLYCLFTGINHAGIFQYFARSLQETTIGERSSGRLKMLQNIAALLFWGGNPFFLAGLAIIGCHRLRAGWRSRQLQAADIYWLGAAAILGGYLFVGGSLFGFPKYQCPAIPLLAISLATAWNRLGRNCDYGDVNQPCRRQHWWLAPVLATITALLALLLLPDPIYHLRITLRAAQLYSQPLRPILLDIGWRLTMLYLLSAAIVLLCLWHRWLSPLAALLTVGIGLNLAILLTQTTAGYSTGYMYGESGETKQVAALIQARQLQSQPLFVPVEAVQHLGWSDDHTPGPDLWSNRPLLAQRIIAEQPALVGVSILINPVPVIRDLLADQQVQQALTADYDLQQIGHFLLWIRRGK